MKIKKPIKIIQMKYLDCAGIKFKNPGMPVDLKLFESLGY
jgi:hypothetical protein